MGRDYIMHHGVKGQHKGHRRWQNPDGSYTDAGFVHYYGHPRIRGQKEKDGKDDLDALHKERKSVVDAELSKDKEYQRLKELHKRGVKEEKGMPIDLLMLEREDEVTRSSGRVTDVEWKMKNAKQKRNMEKAKKFLEKKYDFSYFHTFHTFFLRNFSELHLKHLKTSYTSQKSGLIFFKDYSLVKPRPHQTGQ